MADDDVQITVSDNIASSVETKFQGIANAARDAYASVTKLQEAMGATSSLGQLEQASISAKDFAAALAASGGELSKITPQMLAMGTTANATAQDLRGLTLAQVELYKAQQAGQNFAKDLNASLGVDKVTASAREAASAFQELGLTELEAATGLRGYTEAQLSALEAMQQGAAFAAELDASFALANKSAADSAAVFREVGLTTTEATTGLRGYTEAQIAAMRAAQEGATYTALLNEQLINNSLANKSAAESAAVFSAAIKEETATASAATSQLGSISKLLLQLFAVEEIIKGTDAYIKLGNALHIAGLQGQEFATTQQKIFDTANRNGVAVETLAALYQKLAVSQGILGSTSAQTTQLVEGISAALRLQGASAAAAGRATTDLAEIFDLNTVSMRQWRGVIIQVPSIALAAANGIERFHGSVSALTEAILHGQVTSKELFNGLLVGLKGVQAEADRTQLTISGAFNVLHNKIAEFISDVNQNTGVVGLLTGAIILLANNLNIIIPLVILFGAAWVTVQIAGLIAGIKGLAVAFIEFLPELIAAIVAGAEFTVGFIAAAAALLGLAEVLAFITGNGAKFNAWLQTASNQIVDFAASIVGVGQKANTSFQSLANGALNSVSALNETNNSATKLTQSITKTGTAADAASQQINNGFQRVGNTLDALTFKMNSSAAAASKLYSALAAVGGSSGSFQTAGVTNTGSNSSIQTIGKPDLHFDTGGSFIVGGTPGVDRNRVTFRASQGERVDILTPAQQRAQAAAPKGGSSAPRSIVVNVITPDVDSFSRSRKQVSAALAAMVRAA